MTAIDTNILRAPARLAVARCGGGVPDEAGRRAGTVGDPVAMHPRVSGGGHSFPNISTADACREGVVGRDGVEGIGDAPFAW
jgi:hypothetical protein